MVADLTPSRTDVDASGAQSFARSMRRVALGAFSSVLLFTACATAPDGPGHPLANSRWTLHAIASMDDGQGTTRIDTPQQFTVAFAADGTANFKLDCNRGTGRYVATSTDAVSGSLSFGPIAATRAMCPPPHLDERLVRDLGVARSYLLKEGKLFISLMADGAIYEWHRMTN